MIQKTSTEADAAVSASSGQRFDGEGYETLVATEAPLDAEGYEMKSEPAP